MTAREAMAYGRPVVATRVGGLADLETAVTLVDAAKLRTAVRTLLEDGELRRKAGSAALEHARAHFSPNAAAAALLDAYRITS